MFNLAYTGISLRRSFPLDRVNKLPPEVTRGAAIALLVGCNEISTLCQLILMFFHITIFLSLLSGFPIKSLYFWLSFTLSLERLWLRTIEVPFATLNLGIICEK